MAAIIVFPKERQRQLQLVIWIYEGTTNKKILKTWTWQQES